ncbi:hypothetical protein BJX96DRAFT_45608 [Aspergillus floccosus]
MTVKSTRLHRNPRFGTPNILRDLFPARFIPLSLLTAPCGPCLRIQDKKPLYSPGIWRSIYEGSGSVAKKPRFLSGRNPAPREYGDPTSWNSVKRVRWFHGPEDGRGDKTPPLQSTYHCCIKQLRRTKSVNVGAIQVVAAREQVYQRHLQERDGYSFPKLDGIAIILLFSARDRKGKSLYNAEYTIC